MGLNADEQSIADADFESYVGECLAALRKVPDLTRSDAVVLLARDTRAGYGAEVDEAIRRHFDT